MAHHFQNLKDAYLIRKTKLDALGDEKVRLFEENDVLKERIENSDHVREVIDRLSQLGQGRALKQYEAMLNAAIVDVMEDNAKKVRLELDSAARGYGAPELNIYVERPSGHEMIEYNGGSFNNVISLTSRVFAIMRSKHLRNFMALDEADCHIRGPRKGDYEGDAPSTSKRFYNALYKLSRETDMQSMAITHHDTSLFQDIGTADSDTDGQPNINIIRVIRNEQSGNYLVETTGAPVWKNDTDKGIRSVTLENIANYHKTTFRFGSGVNIITGAHDIGKSQIVNALRLMFYRSGQGGSRLAAHIIRHGQKTGVVRVSIENGLEFVLTIKKSVSKNRVSGKSNIKGDLTWEVYDHNHLDEDGKPHLYNHEGTICKGGLGNNVPEWVGQISGIELSQVEEGKWDGAIAVQIADQSQPSFLTSNTRPKDRAHILSIGQSVDVPRRMKVQNEKELQEAQRTIRANDKRIKEISGLMARMTPLVKDLEATITSLAGVVKNLSDIEFYKKDITDIPRKLEQEVRHLKREKETLLSLETVPSPLDEHSPLSYMRHSVASIESHLHSYKKEKATVQALNNLPESIETDTKIDDIHKAHTSWTYMRGQYAKETQRLDVLKATPDSVQESSARLLNDHAQKLSHESKGYQHTLSVLKVVETISEPVVKNVLVDEVYKSASHIQTNMVQYQKVQAEVNILNTVPSEISPDEIAQSQSYKKIEQTCGDMSKTVSEIVEQEKVIKNLANEGDVLDNEYDNLIDELKICPLCHNDMKEHNHEHV